MQICDSEFVTAVYICRNYNYSSLRTWFVGLFQTLSVRSEIYKRTLFRDVAGTSLRLHQKSNIAKFAEFSYDTS